MKLCSGGLVHDSQTYQDASRALLAQARAELAAGDNRQAAEKAWGAAAQMVKAVCETRGWSHQTHNALRKAVSRIALDTGDRELKLLFKSANLLHVSFYEDYYNAEEVGEGVEEVRRFCDKLSALS